MSHRAFDKVTERRSYGLNRLEPNPWRAEEEEEL
jgi:hypothetical protein